MFDNFSNNKLLRYFFPILFLIPLNFFIISNGMGSGIQWFFFRYQTTFAGDSVIPIATSLNYILSGTITGKSILFELLPLISAIVFCISFVYAMANQTKYAGALLAGSGFIALVSVFNQYGLFLNNCMGAGIPFGSIVFLVYGMTLYSTTPDTNAENLLIKYDYLFLLFGVFLVFSSWTSPIFYNDAIGSQLLPYSILENHTVFLNNYPNYIEDIKHACRFVDVGGGNYVSFFPIVIPLLITPLYVIPYLLKIPNTDLLQLVMSHISAALLSALAVMFIYLSCLYLSNRKIAFLSAIIFAFATSTWSISSQTLFAHGLSGLLLAIMIFLVIRNENQQSLWNIIFLGICSGLFIFNRPSDSLLITPIIGYILWYNRSKIVFFILSGFLSGLPFLIYNMLIFQNVFGGYSLITSRLILNITLIINYLGLLISPNKGLFIFSPVLILAPLGFWIARRNTAPTHRFLMGSVIAMSATVLVYASFDDWMGGEIFGPRYLICVLPYLTIGLCIFFDDLSKKPINKYIIIVIAGLIIISISIQFIGMFYYRASSNAQAYWYTTKYSYNPWDASDSVIINSLYHKSAKPIIRDNNEEWLKEEIKQECNSSYMILHFKNDIDRYEKFCGNLN